MDHTKCMGELLCQALSRNAKQSYISPNRIKAVNTKLFLDRACSVKLCQEPRESLVCDGFVSKNVHKKGRYFNVKIPLKYFAY